MQGLGVGCSHRLFCSGGFLGPGTGSAPFAGLSWPGAVRVAGRTGRPQAGLSLPPLLLLSPSPPFPGVSYRSLFLPPKVQEVSGSRSTLLGLHRDGKLL